MSDLAKIGTTFGIAFLSFWGSIPAGLALGLSPVVVILTSTSSYVVGVILILAAGNPIRNWLLKRFGAKMIGNPESLFRRTWDRFGIVGLGLVAPMLTGAQIGAVIGLALNTPPRKLLIWMTIGAVLWAIILTLLALLGVVGAQAIH